MMARSTNPPFKGRIQKRKTNRLQIIKSSLQRTAGPVGDLTETDRSVAKIFSGAKHGAGKFRCTQWSPPAPSLIRINTQESIGEAFKVCSRELRGL